MRKHFFASDQKCIKIKIRISIENNLNTYTLVNRSAFLKTSLRNQVFNYNGDELLKTMVELIELENYEGE